MLQNQMDSSIFLIYVKLKRKKKIKSNQSCCNFDLFEK